MANAQYLKVDFKNSATQKTKSLHFRLLDHPFVSKWKEALARSRHLPIMDGGVFYGRCVNDCSHILSVMWDSIDTLNELATKSEMRIEMKPHLAMDQVFLDALHKEFERLSADLSIYKLNREKASKALIDLNSSIHQFESFVGHTQVEASPCFSFDVNFVGGAQQELAMEDLEYFTLHRAYGMMYLNYNTVGVPVYYAFIHDEKKPPVPQKTFKADIMVNFNPDAQFEQWDEMGEWLDKNFGWDINDKKLALGYIPLGQCVEVESLTPEQIADLVKNHRTVVGAELVGAVQKNLDLFVESRI